MFETAKDQIVKYRHGRLLQRLEFLSLEIRICFVFRNSYFEFSSLMVICQF